MAGYIKLYRDLQENSLWQEKPYSKGQAWTDIIFKCNHVCKKMGPQYQNIWVLRGQFISSNYKLAETWGWSESSVRKFIKYLVSQQMVTALSCCHYTLFEVIKYCVYQSVDSCDLQEDLNAQKTHRKRTARAQKTPNNNDNNIKNYKDIKDICGTSPLTSKFITPTFDEIKTYCSERKNNIDPEKFFNFYESKGWMVGKNKMKSWKASIITWEKSDKDKPRQFQQKPAQQGNFQQRQYNDEFFESLYVNGRGKK